MRSIIDKSEAALASQPLPDIALSAEGLAYDGTAKARASVVRSSRVSSTTVTIVALSRRRHHHATPPPPPPRHHVTAVTARRCKEALSLLACLPTIDGTPHGGGGPRRARRARSATSPPPPRNRRVRRAEGLASPRLAPPPATVGGDGSPCSVLREEILMRHTAISDRGTASPREPQPTTPRRVASQPLLPSPWMPPRPALGISAVMTVMTVVTVMPPVMNGMTVMDLPPALGWWWPAAGRRARLALGRRDDHDLPHHDGRDRAARRQAPPERARRLLHRDAEGRPPAAALPRPPPRRRARRALARGAPRGNGMEWDGMEWNNGME